MLCKFLLSGCFLATAADYVGLGRATVFRWMKRGRTARRGPYREFFFAVHRALSQAEARDVLRLDRAAEVDWRAAAFRLSRRFPKRWGRGREEVREPAPDPVALTHRLREFLDAADSLEDTPDHGAASGATTDSKEET